MKSHVVILLIGLALGGAIVLIAGYPWTSLASFIGPGLLFLACPIMMMLMMGNMHDHKDEKKENTTQTQHSGHSV